MELARTKTAKVLVRLAVLLAATVLLAGSALATTLTPRVKISRPLGGTVKVTLHNAYFPSTSAVSSDGRHYADATTPRGSTLSLIIPAGLAGRFAAAAKQDLKVFTAQDAATGPQFRLVAGRGQDIVVIDRTKRAGANGENSYGAIRFQLGVGKKAQAFYVGRATKGKLLGQGVFSGAAGNGLVARSGLLALVDPQTLDVTPKVRLNGRTHLWYVKPTTKLTTDLTRQLAASGARMAFDPGVGLFAIKTEAKPVVSAKAKLEIAGGLTTPDGRAFDAGLRGITQSIQHQRKVSNTTRPNSTKIRQGQKIVDAIQAAEKDAQQGEAGERRAFRNLASALSTALGKPKLPLKPGKGKATPIITADMQKRGVNLLRRIHRKHLKRANRLLEVAIANLRKAHTDSSLHGKFDFRGLTLSSNPWRHTAVGAKQSKRSDAELFDILRANLVRVPFDAVSLGVRTDGFIGDQSRGARAYLSSKSRQLEARHMELLQKLDKETASARRRFAKLGVASTDAESLPNRAVISTVGDMW